jgi:phosphoribosylglycinamide formyltransferase 1
VVSGIKDALRNEHARIVVLLSGSGRTLENLIHRIDAGELQARIARVISTRERARGVEIARSAGLPLSVIRPRAHSSAGAFSDAMFDEIRPLNPELVVCAGFLSKLDVPSDFEGRIVNIHPSLLPLFGGKGYYGDRIQQAVLDAGMKVAGCTVHFVDNEYDAGPIIAQQCVPVRDDDTVETLARRVFEVELELYPRIIRAILEGRVHLNGRQVRVDPAPDAS